MKLTVDITKHLMHFDLQTSFACRAGELTAVVGPSGAGKTTLMRIIAGLEQPDRGSIRLGDRIWNDTGSNHNLPTHKRKIGLVFQEYPLFPHMTVRQNIAYGAENDEDVDALMQTFGIAHLSSQRPNSISGGERQRAAFCQALARKPDLLLLDEPFSALDMAARTFLCEQLTGLKQELNIPILHVTHDLREADLLGDNVLAVEQGQISPGWVSRQQHVQTPLAHNATLSYS